jgi:hypothetical protein
MIFNRLLKLVSRAHDVASAFVREAVEFNSEDTTTQCHPQTKPNVT